MGRSPYWFEVELLGSVSSRGKPSVTLDAEDDLYVTQRLVFTVGGSIDWLIADDDALDLPAGIGTVEAGLRARYEVRRKFAPYLDLVWERAPSVRTAGPLVGAATGFRLGAGLRLIH